MKKIYVY